MDQYCRTLALELNAALYVDRVPSKNNIADDPSREKYDLLHRMGAIRAVPYLHTRFLHPKRWESLRLVATRNTAAA